MDTATRLARARAIGAIGPGRVKQLEDAHKEVEPNG